MDGSHSMVLALTLTMATCCMGGHAGDRIAGGHDADINDFPFQLALISPEGRLRGGAVIISESWALTTPTNLRDPLENLTVRAGSSTWFEGGSLHQVTRFLPHDLYDGDSHDFALAVLQVSPPFVFGAGVAACRLPAQGQEVPVGGTSVVAGWGGKVAGTPGPPSDVLQVAEIPVLDLSICKKEYGDDVVTERMLCGGRAMFEPTDLDACNGDEGGPMIVDDVLVGLFSWHDLPGCGYYGLPSVYTRVSSMTDWVLNATDLCCAGTTALTPPGLALMLVAGGLVRWAVGL